MVSMPSHDDALLTRFAARLRGLRCLLSPPPGAILSFFLRRTGDPELATDLTAEVFAAALLAASASLGERPALAWLYGIASHKLADSRRRDGWRTGPAGASGWSRWPSTTSSGPRV